MWARVVDAARVHGFDILPTISCTPRWAADPNCGSTSQTCPSADNARFAEFARQAAERYAPKGVHTWEIWNEPNIKPFWQTGPDAERYAKLLAASAPAIRSVIREHGGPAVGRGDRHSGLSGVLDSLSQTPSRNQGPAR